MEISSLRLRVVISMFGSDGARAIKVPVKIRPVYVVSFFFQQQGVAAFLPCNALILKSAVCILTPLPSYELHSKFGSKL